MVFVIAGAGEEGWAAEPQTYQAMQGLSLTPADPYISAGSL